MVFKEQAAHQELLVVLVLMAHLELLGLVVHPV